MPIHATINERTLRRTFREPVKGKRALTVLDTDLRGFALKVSASGNKTFVVRAARRLGTAETVLGSAGELTAAQAREKAAAVIAGAMGYKAAPPPLPDEAEDGGDGATPDTPPAGEAPRRRLAGLIPI